MKDVQPKNINFCHLAWILLLMTSTLLFLSDRYDHLFPATFSISELKLFFWKDLKTDLCLWQIDKRGKRADECFHIKLWFSWAFVYSESLKLLAAIIVQHLVISLRKRWAIVFLQGFISGALRASKLFHFLGLDGVNRRYKHWSSIISNEANF